MVENAELIAIIALGISLFISGIGAAFALGNLPKRSEFNELRKEVKAVDDKIGASHKELSAKIEESHANLIAEIRRSHQQLMRALTTTGTWNPTASRSSPSRPTLNWSPLTTKSQLSGE